MKKLFFFAVAIAAVSFVSCSEDSDSSTPSSCTCVDSLSGETQVYSASDLEYAGASSCSEFAELMSNSVYTVTCN
ncbi:MAG: hypothetical protein SNF93_05675 [Rikenellaceae bacterium]